MSMDWELVRRYMGNFVRWFFVIFGHAWCDFYHRSGIDSEIPWREHGR